MTPRILLLLLAAFLAACSAATPSESLPTPTPRPAPPALERPTYAAQRGTVVDEIKVSGFIAAVRQQELTFTQDGFLKVLSVDRGSQVTAGTVLAELDMGDVPNQLRQAEVALEQAQNALTKVAAQRSLATRRAELDLADARAQLAELRAPAEPADIAAAEQALARAQADLAETRNSASAAKSQADLGLRQASEALPLIQVRYRTAAVEWEAVRDLKDDPRWQGRYEAYLAADNALKQADSAVRAAQIAFDTALANEGPAIQRAESVVRDAELRLETLRQPPRSADIAAAQRAIERAEIALSEAKASEGDTALEGQVAAASLEVERLQAQLDAGKLIAPFDGEISAIAARPGTAVQAYRAVITIIDDSEKEMLIESISSQQASRIGIGQQVSFSFSRAPGKTYTGTIVALPTSATSSNATIDADRAYHVAYETLDIDVDVGDIAQVVIVLEQVDDAVWLPPQAVRTFEGRRFVVIQDGERQRRQDVRVGIISADRIEILEGLNEGDVVVGQ